MVLEIVRTSTNGGDPRLQVRYPQCVCPTKCGFRLDLYTDGFKSFTGFEQVGFRHVPRTEPLQSDLRKGSELVVPLADPAIGNLQQWLIGTYQAVSREQLQVYLDEFVFRHNRRQAPMVAFQTLLGLGAGRRPYLTRRYKAAFDLPILPGKS